MECWKTTLICGSRRCSACGSVFESCWLPELSYGEVLCVTEDGKRFVIAPLLGEGAAFKEIEQLVGHLTGIEDFRDPRRQSAFEKVFPATLDAVEGQPLRWAFVDRCLMCGSRDIAIGPGLTERVAELPVGTHEAWFRMTREEREALARRALRGV